MPPAWSSRSALCVGQDAGVAGIETGVPSAEPSAYLEDAASASLGPAEARLRLLAEATGRRVPPAVYAASGSASG